MPVGYDEVVDYTKSPARSEPVANLLPLESKWLDVRTNIERNITLTPLKGKGEANNVLLAKNAEERATWLKAPFVRLHSLTFILRPFLAHHFPPFSHYLRLDTTISETQSAQGKKRRKKRLISETHGFLWNRSIRTQRATATTTS